MAYVVLMLVVAVLAYVGWRLIRMSADRPRTRMIGPDDDPDFLRRIGPDNKPRS